MLVVQGMRDGMSLDSTHERILVPAGFTSHSLEANPDVIYVVDRSLHFVYCNAAWDVFARKNKGERLERSKFVGKYCLGGVPKFLRDLYKRIYRRVLSTQAPCEHDYQGSSPTKYRIFHMRVLPLSRSHLLVENSLALERPHRRKRYRRFDPRYVNRHGWIVMCAHCRRVEYFNPKGTREWHWVPSYLVKAPAPISHGMCPACVPII